MEKALICITSCNRLSELKKYILPYIEFTNTSSQFDFVLSIDGYNEEYIKFSAEYKIPMVYSDIREGVGLSKNRILKQFPNYAHYFFIDDDVELLNSKIFNIHVKIGSIDEKCHHMSSTNLFVIEHHEYIHRFNFIYGSFGGGYFNYFNAKSIKKVGGWHTAFAQFKRYGHTEHSYRFYNAGLTKYPFTVIKDCINDLIIHDPIHVTAPIISNENLENELFELESELIKEKLTYFPLKTISNFNFNGFDMHFNATIDKFLSQNKKKYPLLTGKARRKSLSSFYFFQFQISQNKISKIWYFCIAIILFPNNPEIKHLMKKLLKWK